ncbi:MAG: hypothetical protein ABMA01_21855 [Chthoniobacteraceae bacterium]
MKSLLHRTLIVLLTAGVAAPAFAQSAAPAASLALPGPVRVGPAKGRDYVRYIGDNKRGKLETSIVTMKKGDMTVELVGAVHVADPEYYKALSSLFTGYEVLLFELVDGQRLKDQVEGKAAKDNEDLGPAFKVIRGMMQGLGSYFRFQYQTDGIDYHAKNFVHADVSMDEFVNLQADKGESFATLIGRAMEAQLDIGSTREAEPKGSQLLLALLGDSSGLKVAIAKQLAVADELVAAMETGEGSVIISDRNKVALDVFARETAAGRKNLGIFYGAAHLNDMEKRLEKQGYRRTGERWMTAWDIKPRADAKATPVQPKE